MNPYEILGVDKTASQDEIKKAYRKHVMTHHPDKGGDTEKFKSIQNAYEILSDSEKRANFDNPPPPHGGFPADIFAHMFAQQHRNNNGPVKRPDHNYEITITLEEAYHGVNKKLGINLRKVCFSCQNKCKNCKGQGVISIQMGPMILQQPCQHCRGMGFISNGCSSCENGWKNEKINLEVRIPPGIESGNTMTYSGLGEQAFKKNDQNGDLVIQIKILDHPVFVRNGKNLHYTATINFEDSVSGKNIIIPHFDSEIKINTSVYGILDPRKDYIIPNKGFVGGNLYIKFNIIYPDKNVKMYVDFISENVKTVMTQGNVNYKEAVIALKSSKDDVIEALLALNPEY